MKKIVLSLAFMMIIIIVNAQQDPGSEGFEFGKRYHSAIGVGVCDYPYQTNDEKFFAINYAPQLDLTLRYSDMSISLNTQLAAGYHFLLSQDSLKYLTYDIPIFLQGNIGHLASKDFYSDFGFFAGGGYDWMYIRNEFQQRIAATAGIRFWFASQSITVRVTRYFGNQNANYSINSLTLDFNLGGYLSKIKGLNKISDFMHPYGKG
jgi:hypothetical protein